MPEHEHSAYDCPICKDQEWIIDPQNPWVATPCPCAKQKQLHRRIQNALIPEEFEEAHLDNYQVNSSIQRELFQTAKQFVENFSKISQGRQNSMGMVAEVGETQIKRIPDLKQRAKLIQKYNSYGLGKTHLQIAIAKELLQQGRAVLCISDVVFMHDLAQSKRYNDEGAVFYRLLGGVIEAEVLVWDDIGKSKYTEAKEELYYRIINERYRQRKPILFSSNEDELTLSERVGEAAFSRLYSMAKDYFVKVKGPDYRVEGTRT
jgi:DNA replication protein DnaC